MIIKKNVEYTNIQINMENYFYYKNMYINMYCKHIRLFIYMYIYDKIMNKNP